MPKRILINGASGKMGQVCVKALSKCSEFEIKTNSQKDFDLKNFITSQRIDIVIDFTHATSVYENMKQIIAAKAHPIIGTSGLTIPQVDELTKQCEEQKLGGIIAPNFSLGAILMMKYAAKIAPFYSDIEIIEYHHDQKLDSPSGTAIKTAQLLNKHKKKKMLTQTTHETIPGARGAEVDDINIHAIRLPGLLAHQTVIFGAQGETLRLQHDTVSRECYAPGILLSCRKVFSLNTLVYGLESLID